MKEFIVRHPFITFLIVDTVCTTVQNCVCMCVYKSVTSNRPSITKQVIHGAAEAVKETFEKEEKDETEDTVEVEEDE